MRLTTCYSQKSIQDIQHILHLAYHKKKTTLRNLTTPNTIPYLAIIETTCFYAFDTLLITLAQKYACHAYLHNSTSTIHKRSYLKLKVLIRHLQERSNMLAKNSSTKPQFRNWWKEILGVDDENDTRIFMIVFQGPKSTGKTYAVKVMQLAYTSAAYTNESGLLCHKIKTVWSAT